MIYFVGGAPRAGKSILGQLISAQLRIGWISTDLLMDQLRFKNVEGSQFGWDASAEGIVAFAEWFFPSLERFVFGINSMTQSYLIEGVGFLPEQIVQLSGQFPLRSVFLGCSKMSLERFDKFPGRSRGYARLAQELRSQFAQDIPGWSEFIRQEAKRFGCPYVDMSDDFQARLIEAGTLLSGGLFLAEG